MAVDDAGHGGAAAKINLLHAIPVAIVSAAADSGEAAASDEHEDTMRSLASIVWILPLTSLSPLLPA